MFYVLKPKGMNMKYFTMILIVGLCGCSGAALKSEWKDKRGYSDADTQEIMSKMENYKTAMGLIVPHILTQRID